MRGNVSCEDAASPESDARLPRGRRGQGSKENTDMRHEGRKKSEKGSVQRYKKLRLDQTLEDFLTREGP